MSEVLRASVGVILGYWLEATGFGSMQGQHILPIIFRKIFRPLLKGAQPAGQYVTWALPLELERPKRESGQSPSSSNQDNKTGNVRIT
jgi:hypothetical protein